MKGLPNPNPLRIITPVQSNLNSYEGGFDFRFLLSLEAGRAYPPPRHQRTAASSPPLTNCPPPIPAPAPANPSMAAGERSGANETDQTSPTASRSVESAEPGIERSHSLIVPSEDLQEEV